jgi:hypothetical protein
MLPDQSAVYYPEELSLLGQILDQAVQSLPLSMGRLKIARRSQKTSWPVQPLVSETQSNLGSWR